MLDINFKDKEYIDSHSDDIRSWVETSGEEFEDSEHFKNLNTSAQKSSSFLLGVFFEYCYSYCLVGPAKINHDVIDEMMLDVMPRKISADLETFESFSPVMQQFLLWCEEKNYMRNTQSIRDHINITSLEMIERSKNPSYWGMAKSMMMGGPANFNLGNDYQRVRSENISPIKRDTPKIGRNDQCACGSGKKHKKCCLEK